MSKEHKSRIGKLEVKVAVIENNLGHNTRELAEINGKLDDIQDDINNGLITRMETVIKDNMPKEVIVTRGWTMSDTVKVAVITAVGLLLGKVIEVRLFG